MVDHQIWLRLVGRIAPPELDRNALGWVGGRVGNDARVTLAAGHLASIAARIWRDRQHGMAGYFALGTPKHFLNAKPHLWSTFHERQITEGLAFFLNADAADVRRRRIWAVLGALASPGPVIELDEMSDACAIAEAAAPKGQRIDLLVWAADKNGGRLGAVVEAKFEHKLGAHQLTAYRQAAERTHGLDPARSTFTVVAPWRTNLIRRLLQRRLEWRFLSWERFIIRLEERLQALQADDPDFARFRRTIWHRAGH